jgi:hypothetical protein
VPGTFAARVAASIMQQGAHQPAAKRVATPAPRTVVRPGGASLDLLGLQRLVGNQAVRRLVPADGAVIQRKPVVLNHEGKEEDAGDWSDREIALWMEFHGRLRPGERPKYGPSFTALTRLQEEREADRRTFAELGAAQAPRDDARIGAARGLVAEWRDASASRDPPPIAFPAVKGNQGAIAARLISIVEEPFNLNQEDYPICGANAFLHSLAVRQPDVYVRYVLDLIKTGTAEIGDLNVKSPGAVRGKKLDDRVARERRDRKIDIADWVAMASLRASENPRGYKSVARIGDKRTPGAWHAGIKGMSSTKEIAGWYTKVGYRVVEFTDNTLAAYLGYSDVDAKRLVEIGQQFGACEIVLSVNAAQVRAKIPSQRPRAKGADHYVRLASGVAERGKDVFFRVWSWGAETDMKVAKEQVPSVVYGYVVAEPPAARRQEPAQAAQEVTVD